MMQTAILQTAAEVTVKATVVLALCWAITAVTRKSSATLKHAIWMVGMAASLLLLPLAVIVPAWRVVPAPAVVQSTGIRPPSMEPQALLPATPTTIAKQSDRVVTPVADVPQAAVDTKPRAQRIATENENTNSIAWLDAIIPIWALGALLLIVKYGVASVRVRRLVRGSAEVEDAGWLAALRIARQRLGIDAGVLLLQSEALDVPIVWGALRPRVVIPVSALEWDTERRLTVLLHELAHVKRLDTLTQLLGQAAEVVYWFDPLMWVAKTQARNLRERACDDHVLRHGAAASQYAQELLAIVSQLGPRESYTAALAMARRSQIEGRLLAILDPQVRRRNLSRSAMTVIFIAAAAVVLPGAALKWKQTETAHAATVQNAPAAEIHDHSATDPAPEAERRDEKASGPAHDEAPHAEMQEPARPTPPPPAFQTSSASPDSPMMKELAACNAQAHGDSTSSNIIDDDGKHSWIVRWTRGDCSINLNSEGELKFNDRFDEITSISNGGWVDMTMRLHGETRRARYEPSGNGVRVQYWLNGNEMAMDASAKAWVHDFFIMLDRQTAFAIDYRYPQLMKEGGPGRVLDEVNAMTGDYAKAVYLLRLVLQADLKTADLNRTIDTTLRVSSDYETARVLMAIAAKYDLNDASTRASYLRALDKLKSDYEHARVLLTFFGKATIPPELAKTVLESAAKIKSDYELARVLIEMASKKMVTKETESAYVATIGHLNSDYEHARTLLSYLDTYGSDQQRLGPVIQQVGQIKSDYEASRVLQAVAQFRPQGELRDAYVRAANDIKSDYEKKRALSAIGYRQAEY